MPLHIIEKDEAGLVCRRYSVDSDQLETITVQAPHHGDRRRYNLKSLAEIFLPAGFPTSVTPDYIGYQIYDSLQAFSSSIAGLLSSRAVLEGFGVGDENASPTYAMLLTIVQDATSRLATILFAWRLGTALEPEAKMYRLAADVFNDSAIILDCLSPALSRRTRIIALCLSGSLRALCGVAAGGAKAALSVHFAKSGNVGELNAKDSSQETVIGLLGMLCGSVVVTYITSRAATWAALLLLLAIHLTTNYLAVRSVVMKSLNRQRTNIVYTTFRQTNTVLSPSQVSRLERIFDFGGALRDAPSNAFVGTCKVGASLDVLTRAQHGSSRQFCIVPDDEFVQLFSGEKYILWFTLSIRGSRRRGAFYIWAKEGAKPHDLLKAWMHSLELARTFSRSRETVANERLVGVVRTTMANVQTIFPNFLLQAERVGWDVSVGALVTGTLRTVSFQHHETKEKDL